MGQISSNGASGASHAGRGGRGYSTVQATGPYGNIFEESTWGSGGGSNTVNGNNGGRGGGYIHMYTTQSIEISGTITANGGSPSVIISIRKISHIKFVHKSTKYFALPSSRNCLKEILNV